MTTERVGLVYIFYSYAREDKKLRDRLEKHLSILKRLNLVAQWHNMEIDAQQEWEDVITSHLDMADIILLLLSPGFMASDRSYNAQVKHALQRHKTGEARVIPVLLRPVLWQETPFAKLQMLPSNTRPIVTWRNRDEAFVDVIQALQKVIRELDVLHMQEEQTRGVETFELQPPEYLQQELSRDFHEATYRRRPEANTDRYYKEALHAYDQALRRSPGSADAALYAHKADIQFALKRYAEAEATYTQALALAPDNAELYRGHARALYTLGRYTEALAAYAAALTLEPDDAYTYYSQAIVLHTFKGFPRSRAAHAQAIALNPSISETYQDDEYALPEPPSGYVGTR